VCRLYNTKNEDELIIQVIGFYKKLGRDGMMDGCDFGEEKVCENGKKKKKKETCL
jgi:hypothetical protein